MRADHGLIALVAGHLAARADLDLGHHGQTVLVGVQAQDTVTEHFGQHRNDGLGKVDAEAAAVGLAVERRAGLDQGRHVGDGHRQGVAAPGLLDADRVVEVARMAAIDREQNPLAQVAPALELGFQIDGRGKCGLGEHLGREFPGQAVLDGHVRQLAAGVFGQDQDFLDRGLDLALLAAGLGLFEPRHHDVAWPRTFLAAGRHDDAVGEGADRPDFAHPALLREMAGHGAERPFQDGGDMALVALAVAAAGHLDRVAVDGAV
ncbi:MAG: hypothetical protein BWY87_01604 [Deltaproteobacteria bacterium ADurb.Bin510]|nr:MAG: hypothetical protein BWY87_01604 [Deltaproteobacteria bacterium ADurb.Bin510]